MTFLNDWETPGRGFQLGRFEMSALPIQTIFNYTGAVQYFQVPADREAVRVIMYGAGLNSVLARPNNDINYGYGFPTYRDDFGYGCFASVSVRMVLPVVPGEQIEVYVGGGPSSPSGGWPDGGGGGSRPSGSNGSHGGAGSTSLRRLGADFRDSLIVLGGSGGMNDTATSRNSYAEGIGGGCVGLYSSQSGNNNNGQNADYGEITYASSRGGQPGTLIGPGLGGQESTTGEDTPGVPISWAGIEQYGGRGGRANNFGFSGGGGGGGWYGGGGAQPVTLYGGGSYAGDGGGGSSYVNPSSGIDIEEYVDASHVGHGQVIFFL